MAPARTAPISPAEAVRRGRRALLEQRARAAEAARIAALKPWKAPMAVETTRPVRSQAAPGRWLRVWRAPVAAEPKVSAEFRGWRQGWRDCLAAVVAVGPADGPTASGGDPVLGIPMSEQDQTVTSVSGEPTLIPAATIVSPELNAHAGCAGRPATGSENGVDLTTAGPAGGPTASACKSGSQYSKPIPGPVAKRAFLQNPTPTAKAQHPPGRWPLADLGPNQCRFACTPHHAHEHRFCGAPTRVGRGNLHGSWCAEHLPIVWGVGSASERNAVRDARRVG